MSRLKRFAHSVLSGYVMLGANIFYTLASIPLALHFLSRPEFGLWALTMQISGYIALIDMGMSGSVSLVLIDYKDKPADGGYGSIIKTGTLVGMVQGLIIFIFGSVLALGAGALLKVPAELQRDFAWLLVGQSGILGLTFATRIFSHLLAAHQRYDISNHAQSVLFGVSLLVMWIGFRAGLGVFSFLVAQAVGAFVSVVVNVIGCLRLKLFPAPGRWGSVSGEKFRELFGFGRDLFFYSMGTQLVNASQTVLLTRFLGLDVAAVWSVCIRVYTMLTMLVWRIQDYAAPVLAEMINRQEHERLSKRFTEIAVFTTALSLVCGVILAACNSPFVALWTHGKIHWDPVNDLLLGFWLFIRTSMRAHIVLIIATKRFGFLRYIFLLEGAVFVGLYVLFHQRLGVTGMLALSIACTAAFTLPYGLFRTRTYLVLSGRKLADWYRPMAQLAWRMAAVALGLWWLARGLMPMPQFLVNLVLPGAWAFFLVVRYGLSPSLLQDITGRLPLGIRRYLHRSDRVD